MKRFFKNIQTMLQDFWAIGKAEIVGIVFIGGVYAFALYAGLSKIEDLIVIITLFILYKSCVFIWFVLNKIKGFDKIVLKVGKLVRILILLFFGLMFLDIIGYLFFKDYLGYNYFSVFNHFVF